MIVQIKLLVFLGKSKSFNLLRLDGLRESLHFHCIRHTFLTQLARKVISIYHIKQIAGHSDIKTTEIYLHTVTDDLRNAVNKVNINF